MTPLTMIILIVYSRKNINLTKILTINRLQCDFKIKVLPSIYLDKTIFSALKTVFEQIKDAEGTVQILSWIDKCTVQIIKKVSNILILINDHYIYFPNIRPRNYGGVYYSKIKLHFAEHFHNLKVNINSWIKSKVHGLYKYTLQVENL